MAGDRIVNSNSGTQVVKFSGNASNSLKYGATYLKTNNDSSYANTNIGSGHLVNRLSHCPLTNTVK